VLAEDSAALISLVVCRHRNCIESALR
jgi:hypothetical protein